MGYYTTLKVDIRLNKDTPENIKLLLRDLINLECKWIESTKSSLSHPFFHDERYETLGSTRWQTPEDPPVFEFPTLKIRCETKNYDKVLQKFLDWITPYVKSASGTFCGEEDQSETKVEFTNDGVSNRFLLRRPSNPDNWDHWGFGCTPDEEEQMPVDRLEFIPTFA